MKSHLTYLLIALGALAILLLQAASAWGQSREYSLAMRGVDLEEALAYFVEATGEALAYDADLVQNKRTFCVAERQSAERILRCLLAGTGLDYFRRSSGTYVLTAPIEQPPEFGNLTGAVLDGETLAPLASAHVRLAGLNVGTTTNQAGQFVFPPLLPGRYVMYVSFVGYRTWQDTLFVAAHSTSYAQAELTAEPVLIRPVIIDADEAGRLRVDRRTGTATSSNPPVGFGSGPSSSGLQLLHGLMGVRLSESVSDIHLQGGETGAHELRIDGVPVFLPRQTVGFVGPMSPFAIERLRIHKAGYGVAAGSQIGGVVEAEQVVDAPERIDVQIDPVSVNARIHASSGSDDMPRFSATAAARVGLWGTHQPSALSQTLNNWSAPDPFVLLAPLRRYRDMNPEFLERSLLLNRTPNPDLYFSDIHSSIRYRAGLLRTLHGSFYRGSSSLKGDQSAITELDEAGRFGTTRTPVTVRDGYDWLNYAGQVRYDAIMNGRTLWSTQASLSSYRFDQKYEFFESLTLGFKPYTVLDAAKTTSADDGNRVKEIKLSTRLDQTRQNHNISFEIETAVTDSRFKLRMASVGAGLLDFEVTPTVDLGFEPETPQFDTTATFSVLHGTVKNDTRHFRVSTYAQDRFYVGRNAELEVGTRLTYQPERRTVYAEPRVGIASGLMIGGVGEVSARLAAGLYRQFVNQFDLSTLNAGALLPSTRIWLPLDETVRPPKAYHIAPSLSISPNARWTVVLEGYYKRQPHRLVINYAIRPELLTSGVVDDQSDFLTSSSAEYYGGAASIERRSSRLQMSAKYEYSVVTTRSEAFFEGRTVPASWNAPHRVDLAFDWRPLSRTMLSARWKGVWERPWGLSRAYYDYFGHSDETRYHPGFDLGDPAAQRLPAIMQLDLTAAYSQPIGPATAQLRLDVLNVFDRHNIVDWRLQFAEGHLQTTPRYLPPRFVALAARITW